MERSLSATPPQPAAAAPTDAVIRDSGLDRFQADVLEASLEVPVLVDFWAPWCGPCRQLTPILEKVVTALGGRIRLVKINVDENQALAGHLGVQSIPAVFGFLGGRAVDRFMGALPESEVARFAKRLVDAAAQAGIGATDSPESQIEAALEAARAALEANDTARALQIYTLVLQHAPDNPKALIGLARLQLADGETAAARETFALLPAQAKDIPGYEALEKALRLAAEAEALGDAAPLHARLEADPDDHQARFDLALVLNARDDKVAAAEQLVEIMRRDREWNEDGARKKLLELFEAWGGKDPATVKGRRMLSSLLFR